MISSSVGKISLPSTILQFWDLGGQRDIRSIWPRYYSEAHAVVYVVDAADPVRLEEGWAVFEEVLAHPLTLNLPLLVLANKQDAPGALSGTDIRESYERWAQKKREGAAEEGKQVGEGGWLAQGRSGGTEALGDGGGSGGLLSPALEDGFPRGSTGGMEGRGGSLEVLGVSALEGYVSCRISRASASSRSISGCSSDGVRAAIEWLFLRLQTSRRR